MAEGGSPTPLMPCQYSMTLGKGILSCSSEIIIPLKVGNESIRSQKMEQIWEFGYTTLKMDAWNLTYMLPVFSVDLRQISPTRDSVLSHGSNTVQLHLNHLNPIRFPFDESSIFNSPTMFYRFKFKLSTGKRHTVEELTEEVIDLHTHTESHRSDLRHNQPVIVTTGSGLLPCDKTWNLGAL
jgi:hypothetical protein